ncbi:MAG: phenylalanine--tRNA ligase subunit beta [Lachnospiraceae bacterium]|nr:phenylalanine--tRNA ligase subunit beta [Lachnospiraceae bacterium]
MRTSLKWIKALVPGIKDVGPQEYLDTMTLAGQKGEYYVELNKNLEKIVVGKVLSVEKHPDADKLVICQVDVGQEAPVQIVTGAPNVFEGAVVPVVLDGGKVAGGHDGSAPPENGIKIKKGKLRGVESFGMMCSIEELGSSRNFYPEAPEDGIYIFSGRDDIKPGDDAVAALGLDDAVIEYEITSNRVDCFSIIGIAREAAVAFNTGFMPPVVEATGNSEDVNDYVSVEVRDADLCPRFTARMVKNVKIGPSPDWMQRRLAAQGIRPINNIVDITNYVMEEFGQPMHAYDLSTIRGSKIIVRRADDGEKFVTLDGQERDLDSDMLMICDAEGPIGIGGIMGGENSMITGQADTVLFEAANFNGTNVRLSGKRLGMHTDAQAKFEKGLDPNNAEDAINRACQLVEMLGCGEVVGGMVDVYPVKKESWTVPFEPERINKLLGTSLTADEMLDILKRLELTYDEETGLLHIPTFRQDLLATCDIAEEVARFFGYANVPSTLPDSGATAGGLPFDLRVQDLARDVAEFCGYSEAMTFSFESPKVFDMLRLDADDPLRSAITIANPQGEDYSIMRTLPVSGMLTTLARNYNRRNKEAKLYEMAKVYLPKTLPLTEYPDERVMFTLGFYGDGDFFTLKGAVEEFLDKAGIKRKRDYDPNAGKNFLHPGRQANILLGDEILGYLGEVHPDVCDSYDLGTRAYIAVIDMAAVDKYASFDRHFSGIAKYPAVTRDISMVVNKKTLAGSIEHVIEKNGGSILESYELFDIYEGEQIGLGFRSLAYSLTFRSKERTLEDKEVNAAMDKILKGLGELGIALRE